VLYRFPCVSPLLWLRLPLVCMSFTPSAYGVVDFPFVWMLYMLCMLWAKLQFYVIDSYWNSEWFYGDWWVATGVKCSIICLEVRADVIVTEIVKGFCFWKEGLNVHVYALVTVVCILGYVKIYWPPYIMLCQHSVLVLKSTHFSQSWLFLQGHAVQLAMTLVLISKYTPHYT
jgi:hypothetical protein